MELIAIRVKINVLSKNIFNLKFANFSFFFSVIIEFEWLWIFSVKFEYKKIKRFSKIEKYVCFLMSRIN